MAVDSTKIRIAGTGSVWKAPTGTTLPTDSTTALNAAFKNLGFVKNGFEVNQDFKTQEIEVWQTLEPVRQFPTGINKTISFEAVESNNVTVALAWNNATITTTSGGVYTMSIPSSYVNTEFSIVADMSDGTTSQRIVIPRATLNALPKITAGRQDAITYQFEIQILAPVDNSASVLVYGVDAGIAS